MIEVTADKIISQTEVQRLKKELEREKAAALSGVGKISFVTDFYLINLTLRTGLRISEVAELEWRDVHEGFLMVRIGKGGKKKPNFLDQKVKALEHNLEQLANMQLMKVDIKELVKATRKELAETKLAIRAANKRSVYFGKETEALLVAYREWQVSQGKTCGLTDKLFHGVRGPLTRYGIHERFDYWRKRLGFSDEISFHSLRHYYATWLLEQGVSIAMISKQLGHASTVYTAGYLHHTTEAREVLVALL